MQWKWYVNDSAGNWNESATYNLIVFSAAGVTISGPGGGGSGSLSDFCTEQGLVLGEDGLCVSREAFIDLGIIGIEGIWSKLFPDYSLNKIDGICQEGEDALFYNKQDCAFPLINFIKDKHYQDPWVTRFLFVIILMLIIYPNLESLWRKEY